MKAARQYDRRRAVARLGEISKELTEAEGQPDYEARYRAAEKEAEALFADDPDQSDFMEAFYCHRPDFVDALRKGDRTLPVA
jgi:hypothetical protein